MSDLLIGAAAVVAGAIASIVGFGIGSILTPLLSLQVGIKMAVAAISIPHFAATFVRFWMLRKSADKSVLINFGVLSATGALAGALLHSVASNPALTTVFGALLIFAGGMSLTSYARNIRFGPRSAWIAGGLNVWYDEWEIAVGDSIVEKVFAGVPSSDRLG